MKTCKLCNFELDESNFHKNKNSKDKLDSRCKSCCKAYKKEHRINNIQEYKKRRNDAYLKIKNDPNFKSKKAKYDKEYATKNKDKIYNRLKDWRNKTKNIRNKVANTWRKNKRKTDVNFKLQTYVSNYIRDCLKSKKGGRSYKNFVSYSIDDLINHLESRFTKGMTWENHGEWHIDHIIPVSNFDFTDEKNIIICWSLENLQPLWATTSIAMKYGESKTYVGNIEKGNRLPEK